MIKPEVTELKDKKPIKFMAGTVEKTMKVKCLDYEVLEIEFEDIRSKTTKQNLLTLGQIYDIDWIYFVRYPVNGRLGYIVKGLMGKKPYDVTYVRCEREHRASGSTDLYFDKGKKLPVGKLIRSHQSFPKKLEIWGRYISPKTIHTWFQMTRNERFLMSWEISQYLRECECENTYTNRVNREESILKYISQLARSLDKDKFDKLLATIQKIQFERVG